MGNGTKRLRCSQKTEIYQTNNIMSGKPNCGKCRKPKSQCKCGRPTVMTEIVISKLEEALKIDCTIWLACSYAGISEVTYYDHYKKDPVFSKRMDDAEKYLHLLAHQERAKKIKSGEWEAIKEFKKKRDIRYKDKSEIDTAVDLNIDWDNVPIETLTKIIRMWK